MNLLHPIANIVKYLIVFACFCLLSCTNQNEDQLLASSNNALISSTEIIKDENHKIFDLLERKKFDVQYAEVTSRWEPKGKLIRDFSKSLLYDIHNLKDSFSSFNKVKFEKLYKNISKYRSECYAIDDHLKRELEHKKILINSINDSSVTKNSFLKSFQSYQLKEDYIAALNVIENNIVFLENFVLKFCNNYSDFIRDNFSFHFPILVNQNTKHLKAGEVLEVNAGVGSFSMAAMPKIKIDGKDALITEHGVTEYKLVAPNDIGRHILPINISYTQPDGTVKSFEYKLEYFVDP